MQTKLGTFNKVPSDQVIEQIINKDQNGSGGITESTVQRWIVSNHIIWRLFIAFIT